MMFQPTPPRGRRPATASPRGSIISSFNPRLRAGGDASVFVTLTFALAFQPTPPRGRRLAALCGVRYETVSFNPRLRAGGDAGRAEAEARPAPVSTHASAREATGRLAYARHQPRRFNPRLRAGGDSATACECSRCSSFNPRLRAGGDQGLDAELEALRQFQPTPPRGRRRVIADENVEHHVVFQPTPPRGRRPLQWRIMELAIVVSTHASAREATCQRLAGPSARRCFNPRLRAGGDLTALYRACLEEVFQPTPPRGRRRGLL